MIKLNYMILRTKKLFAQCEFIILQEKTENVWASNSAAGTYRPSWKYQEKVLSACLEVGCYNWQNFQYQNPFCHSF